jgi:hypothetical protein
MGFNHGVVRGGSDFHVAALNERQPFGAEAGRVH